MTRLTWLVLIMSAFVASPAIAKPSAALLVASAPGPSETEIARLRQRLSSQYRLVEDPTLRALLEKFASRDRAEVRLRLLLSQAGEALRRFDVPAVQGRLDEARQVATGVMETEEGRTLWAELLVREAELGLLMKDRKLQQKSATLLLSLQPTFQLDPNNYSPALVGLLDAARAQQRSALRVSLTVATTPPGASVTIAGRRYAPTPTEISDLVAGPQLLWIAAAGARPRVERIEAQPGATVRVRLDSLGPTERLEPIVDGVRRSLGSARPSAARVLAQALEVDGVLLIDKEQDRPTLYRREDGSPSDRAPTLRRRIAYSLVAVGAAGLVTGAIFGGVALREQQAAANDPVHASVSASLDRGAQLALGANVAFALGGVAAAAGIIWSVVEWRLSQSRR